VVLTGQESGGDPPASYVVEDGSIRVDPDYEPGDLTLLTPPDVQAVAEYLATVPFDVVLAERYPRMRADGDLCVYSFDIWNGQDMVAEPTHQTPHVGCLSWRPGRRPSASHVLHSWALYCAGTRNCASVARREAGRLGGARQGSRLRDRQAPPHERVEFYRLGPARLHTIMPRRHT